MAVSFVADTNGLLNAWQRRMHVSPWHFNQVTGTGTDAPLSTPGQQVYVQPERETITEGIKAAQALTYPLLGFYHRPMYTTVRVDLSMRKPIRSQTFEVRTGHVHNVARRGTTVIEAAAAVVYSDEDGDGIDETATITVSTTVADASQVQVFFKAADSLAAAADPRYQIEPLSVSIAGGTATITGHRSLFVTPAIWRRPYNAPNYNSSSKLYAETTDANDFVTEVAVYRVYPDESAGAAVIYCSSLSDGLSERVTAYDATGLVVDSRNGLVRLIPPSGCLCSSGVGVRYADVSIYSGLPLDPYTHAPDHALELAILRLTNAEMPMPTPPSDARANIFFGDTQVYSPGTLAPSMLQNPLGVKVGQVEAWRTIQRYMQTPVMIFGGQRKW